MIRNSFQKKIPLSYDIGREIMALEQIEMFRDLTKIELAKLLGKLNKQDIPIGTTLF
jgi:hypothetical protein